eukprot:scaffold6781_cov107-Isochrysis_galbana.AAC.1
MRPSMVRQDVQEQQHGRQEIEPSAVRRIERINDSSAHARGTSTDRRRLVLCRRQWVDHRQEAACALLRTYWRVLVWAVVGAASGSAHGAGFFRRVTAAKLSRRAAGTVGDFYFEGHGV